MLFTVLTPDPVQNLTAGIDTHNPSVTLKWGPPVNCKYPENVTTYQICLYGWMYYIDGRVVGSSAHCVSIWNAAS